MSKVYISYRWQEPVEGIVRNWLCEALNNAKVEFSIDVKDCPYKKSIGKYEEEIGRGESVIIVVSHNYLHSIQCMYEAALITSTGNLSKRVFPIQIGDYDHDDRYYVDLCAYWNQKRMEASENLAMVNEDQATPLRKKKEQIELILDKLGSFWEYLSDDNFATFSEVSKDSFAVILEYLKVERRASIAPIELSDFVDIGHPETEEGGVFTGDSFRLQ